jgi:hypothetical protein
MMPGPPFTTGPLTSFPPNALLDMPNGMGQVNTSYRFVLFNAVSGLEKGDITPLRTASLTHDTNRTIKRQLTLTLGTQDSAYIDPISDRIRPYMVLSDGSQWPLGVFMFTDQSRQQFTSGNLENLVLNDEMFLVDQEVDVGINGVNEGVTNTIYITLADLPITVTVEFSDFEGTQAWTVGTGRGSILSALCQVGDLFTPWFDNTGIMRFIRTFDPATMPPDFDFDTGNKVLRSSIMYNSEVLTAPNRYIVISNASQDPTQPIFASAVIPVNAPNSFQNRGFFITKTLDLPVATNSQAAIVARGLAVSSTILEQVSLVTAPDPRHDSYNVIRWQGANWLEIGWGLGMGDGGLMTHQLRKAYT